MKSVGSRLPYQLFEALLRTDGLEGAESLVEGNALSGSPTVAEGSDGRLPEVLQRSDGFPEEAQEVRDHGLLPLPPGLQD